MLRIMKKTMRKLMQSKIEWYIRCLHIASH